MQFYTQKSFKYNKVIQWILQDMIKSKLIDIEDKYKLIIDNVSLDEAQERNLKT